MHIRPQSMRDYWVTYFDRLKKKTSRERTYFAVTDTHRSVYTAAAAYSRTETGPADLLSKNFTHSVKHSLRRAGSFFFFFFLQRHNNQRHNGKSLVALPEKVHVSPVGCDINLNQPARLGFRHFFRKQNREMETEMLSASRVYTVQQRGKHLFCYSLSF